MSLDGLVLKEGGTTTTSGGTDMTFGRSGKSVTNGIAIVNTGDSDILTREEIICVSKASNVNADGSMTKQKTKLQYTIPFETTDNGVVYSLVRVEIEVHPLQLSASATLIDTLREQGAQLLKDADTDAFWDTGSLS